MADLDKLYGAIPEGALWINRMTGELSREALADDLDMGASMSQAQVVRWFEATKTIGKAPECPPVEPCPENPNNDNDGPSGDGPGSCAFGHAGTAPVALAGLVMAAAFALSRRRRRW
jgi:MYXO-CTERM domain-containing protein